MKYYKIKLKSGEEINAVRPEKDVPVIDGFIGVEYFVDVERSDSPRVKLERETRYINLDTIAEIDVKERVKE